MGVALCAVVVAVGVALCAVVALLAVGVVVALCGGTQRITFQFYLRGTPGLLPVVVRAE